MRFWDSSALVAVVLDEPSGDALEALLGTDPLVAAWWATPVECASAIARRERDGSLPSAGAAAALAKLGAIAPLWHEIAPTPPLRTIAQRLLRVHPLRGGDALQLAAAIVAAGRDPSSLEFVTLDDRLADTATREGFRVVAAGE